ncbi:hypothetical protein A9Q76_01895 [Arcobacter sp. 31_11_sub10_T18]|nr:hypothetical protein A9Q76_01895 [Arcobacter sp. 31_11_sub10_T18]
MHKLVILFLSFTLFIFANDNKTLIFSLGQESPIQKISFDVLKIAYKKIGYDIESKYYPFERALITSNTGEVDGELSRIKGINSKYKNLIPITIPINFIEGYAFSWNKNLSIKNWDSLKQYNNLCVIGIKFVEKNLRQRGILCDEVAGITQTLKMLEKKRYDVVVLPKINGISGLRKTSIVDVQLVGNRLIKINLYHYLHKKNKHLIKKLQAVLLEMERSGRISKIREACIKKYKLK